MRNLFLIGCACGVWTMLIIGVFQNQKSERDWQREAVVAGHAHYDTMTGEFKWNEPCGTKPQKEEEAR